MTQHALVWAWPIACLLAGLFLQQQQAAIPLNIVAGLSEMVR